VDFVKVAQQKFYRFYYDPYVKFEDPTFNDFNAIETSTTCQWIGFLTLMVVKMLFTLPFCFFGHKYPIYYIGEDGSASSQPITKEAFGQVVNKLEEECEGAT
jgi:hypothetical protein